MLATQGGVAAPNVAGLSIEGTFIDPFGHLWLVGDKSPLQTVEGTAPEKR